MRALHKKLYSPLVFDGLFTVAGAIAIAGLALTTGHGTPAIEPAAKPMLKGAALVAALLAGWIIAMQSARLDQKLADDFLFHTLTKSAFIGMLTFIISTAFWHALFAAKLGGLADYTTLGVAVAAWSLSYCYTRLRGTRA